MLTIKDDFCFELSSQDEQLLSFLADGQNHSGDELGQKLGVTRTTIANIVHRLQGLGLEINSVKNSGYRLCFVPHFLNASEISKFSGAESFAYVMVDSTNNFVLKHHELTDGSVVAADFQSAGRGRRGRRFLSGCGTQALFTYVASFPSFENLQGLSVLAGVSAARVLESMGVKGVCLKWPNDIYIGRSKLGGILIESAMKGGRIFTAIGIGINISSHLHELLGDSVGQDYTTTENASGFELNRSELIGRIAATLSQDLVSFKDSGLTSFMQEFNSRALYIGETVNMTNDNHVITGIFKGISASGALLLKTEKKVETILCGDMSLRLAEDVRVDRLL